MIKIRVNYGYADGTGEYYITIDTDKCDGCGECVEVCPNGILEVAINDFDESKAAVKPEFSKTLGYECLGFHRKCVEYELNCHTVCQPNAIQHSW